MDEYVFVLISLVLSLLLIPSPVNAQYYDTYNLVGYISLLIAIALGIYASFITLYNSLSLSGSFRYAFFFLGTGILLVVTGFITILTSPKVNEEFIFFLAGYVFMLIGTIKIYKFQQLFKEK